MVKWSVTVSNLGTVCDNADALTANRVYNEYVDHSVIGYGRAAGESVALLRDGALFREHSPSEVT